MSTAINNDNTGTWEVASGSGRLAVVPPADVGIGCRLSSPACDAVPGRGVYHGLHRSGPADRTDTGPRLLGAGAVRRTECRHGCIPPRTAGRRRGSAPASAAGWAFTRCGTGALRVRGAVSRPPHPVEYVERAQLGFAALTLAAVSTALVVIALLVLAHLRAGSVVPSAPETVPTVSESYSEPPGGAQHWSR